MFPLSPFHSQLHRQRFENAVAEAQSEAMVLANTGMAPSPPGWGMGGGIVPITTNQFPLTSPTPVWPLISLPRAIDPCQHPFDHPWIQAGVLPHTFVHQLLSHEAPYLYLDLASYPYRPLMLSSWSFTANSLVDVGDIYLEQVATSPPVHYLTITCSALAPYADDWRIVIDLPTMGHYVRVRDVLAAVYHSLQTPVMQERWHHLGYNEREAIEQACMRRERAESFAMVHRDGVRRVDFLRNKHFFERLVRVREGDGRHFELLLKERPL